MPRLTLTYLEECQQADGAQNLRLLARPWVVDGGLEAAEGFVIARKRPIAVSRPTCDQGRMGGSDEAAECVVEGGDVSETGWDEGHVGVLPTREHSAELAGL